VLVDAAALAANTPIDLTKYPADLVVTSFYKIFGHPTGIGALLVRNGSHSLSSWVECSLVDSWRSHTGITRICDSESAALLNKAFFGGGTVEASLSTERYCSKRD
jgi:molybdenum cofactor sulfurtransferase